MKRHILDKEMTFYLVLFNSPYAVLLVNNF